MFRFFRTLAARLTLRFSPARKRWREHLGVWIPIIAPAFPKDPCAHVLIMRLLDDMKARRLEPMRQKLMRLHRMASQSGHAPDMALFHVLAGAYHITRGDAPAMADCMGKAEEAGHRFHLPHVMRGVFYLHDTWNFQRCLEEMDKAIDCVYGYPPLDENKRRGIAAMHADMALAMVMMRRLDEAERLLIRAAPAQDTAEYLHAQATLRAVQGRRDEAQKALDALQKADPRRHADYSGGIRLMMEGTHPHFTAKEPDQEAIAAYWRWFSGHEKEMRRLLIKEGPHTCFQYQQEAFAPLVPEPMNIDRMVHNHVLIHGKPEIHFLANHSATYGALIEALIAACPEEIKAHWTLRGFPGGMRKNPQETITYYAQQAAEAAPQEDA